MFPLAALYKKEVFLTSKNYPLSDFVNSCAKYSILIRLCVLNILSNNIKTN